MVREPSTVDQILFFFGFLFTTLRKEPKNITKRILDEQISVDLPEKA